GHVMEFRRVLFRSADHTAGTPHAKTSMHHAQWLVEQRHKEAGGALDPVDAVSRSSRARYSRVVAGSTGSSIVKPVRNCESCAGAPMGELGSMCTNGVCVSVEWQPLHVPRENLFRALLLFTTAAPFHTPGGTPGG